MGDDHVEQLLARWDELRERGEEVSAEELCAGQPELAAALNSRIRQLKAMDWLDEPDRPDGADEPLAAPDGCCCALPQAGALLGARYQLEALIAEGGFGQVWRAVDQLLLRPVAVKVMALNCVTEARRVARLKHPGIVAVHDVGDGGDFCFIVFQLVDGTDLAERLRRGPLPWREAAALVGAVAEYLHHAHEQGFVHRDIKPANILLDETGRPVLADFGVAMTAAELRRESVTTTGTLAYMAPEQLTPGAEVDARADIYSLGVVLHEALAGRLPFQGDTVVAVRERILRDVPPPLTSATVPTLLEEICRKCLAKQPAERYGTAQALACDLADFLRAAKDAAV